MFHTFAACGLSTGVKPIAGSGGTSSALVDYGDLDMISILEFGSKSDTDNSALFQAAVNSGRRIYVPKGVWNITSSVTYTDKLLLTGEVGYATNSGEWAQIIGSADLGYVPVFRRANHYMRYSNSGSAPHQWVSSSGDPAAVANDAIVQIENIDLRSYSENNSIVQCFGCKQATIKYCQIAPLFRGIEFIRCDGAQVLQCNYARTANPSWVANVAKLTNSYGFMTDGNTLLDQSGGQGGLTALVVHGDNVSVSGGRFEVLHYGIIVGGKSPDPSTLNAAVTPSACVISTCTFESTRRNLILELGSGSEFRNFAIIGSNCFNDSGIGDGQPIRYGIKLISIAASASIHYGTIQSAELSEMVDANESPITSGYPLVAGVGEPP